MSAKNQKKLEVVGATEKAPAGFDTTWYWGVFQSPRAFAQLAATWELFACAFGWDQKTGGWSSQFMSQLDDRRGYVEITYMDLGQIKYPDLYSEKPVRSERKAQRGIERMIEDFKLSGVQPIVLKKCGTITNQWGKRQQAPNKYCLNESFPLLEALRTYVLREDLLARKEGKALTLAMISFLREEGKKIGCVQITRAARTEYRESRAKRRKKGKKAKDNAGPQVSEHFGVVQTERVRELSNLGPKGQYDDLMTRLSDVMYELQFVEDEDGKITAQFQDEVAKMAKTSYLHAREMQAQRTPHSKAATQSERARSVRAMAETEDGAKSRAHLGLVKSASKGSIGNRFLPGESDRFEDGSEKPF